MSKSIKTMAVLLMTWLVSIPASAWSLKEHILMTRIAAERLIADPNTPADMKEWLKAANRTGSDMDGEKKFFLHQRVGLYPRGVDGLGFWAVIPDLEKLSNGPVKANIAPFGIPESSLHFTDAELLNPAQEKHTFKDDLSSKPKLEEVSKDMADPAWKKAGMLPFRVADVYKKLVDVIRAGKLNDKNGQYPRDEHAEHWAGFLAHYLEDNTQPHHATIDFNSKSYFAKSTGRSPGIHGNVEGLLMDDDHEDYMHLREEFWPIFVKALDEVKDPATSNEPWQATVEVMLYSYDYLPLIGRAAQAGYKIGGTATEPAGAPAAKIDADAFFHVKMNVHDVEISMMEMKAQQMALGVKRVQRVWLQAWNEAHQPARD